jgi:hypothetical protein
VGFSVYRLCIILLLTLFTNLLPIASLKHVLPRVLKAALKKKKKPLLHFHQEVGDSRANTCMKVTNIANVISRKKKGENKL